MGAHEKISECIERLKDYAEDSIPVLSEEGKILGVITAYDIVEAVDEEMGEDYAKLAGLTAEEDLEETTFQSMKKTSPVADHPAVFGNGGIFGCRNFRGGRCSDPDCDVFPVIDFRYGRKCRNPVAGGDDPCADG